MIDPYSIAWMFKRVNKLVPDVVGHTPQEISCFVWFSSSVGEQLTVKSDHHDVKRRYLERLIDLINKNYKTPNNEAEEFLDELSLHTEHIEHMYMDLSL